jgi:glycerol-3-phosphate dehydrogenase
MFPDIHLEVKDVESSWAGLRPLIHEEGKSASEMSRKDEIFESESGLVSIAGGKLTGYRKMAERVVDVIVNKLPEGKKLKKNHTQKIPLANGQLKDQKAVNDYKQELRQRVGSFGLEPYYAAYLVANYGKQSDQIVEQIAMESNYSPEEALLVAELAFTMENEMVNTALDFFNRRTGRLYFNLPSILPNLSLVLDRMGEVLDWDTSRRKEEENAVKSAIAWISEFQQKQQITS